MVELGFIVVLIYKASSFTKERSILRVAILFIFELIIKYIYIYILRNVTKKIDYKNNITKAIELGMSLRINFSNFR